MHSAGVTKLAALTVTLTALLSASAPAGVHAQDDDSEARALFQLASVHYREGRFLEAAEEFERAYQLSGEAVLTHNIYLCYRDANQPEPAALWLRRYLESGAEVENRAVLEARLEALEATNARGGDGTDGSETPPPDESGPSTANIVGHATAFTIAGLTLITGAITGILTVAADADLSERCAGMIPCDDINGAEDKKRMQSLALATDILLATSLTAAAVGLVIALLGRSGGDDEEPAPVACGTTGCRLNLTF